MSLVSSSFSVQFPDQFLGWKLLCTKAFSSVLFLVSSTVSGKKEPQFPEISFDVFKVNFKSLVDKGIERLLSFQTSFQTLLQFPNATPVSRPCIPYYIKCSEYFSSVSSNPSPYGRESNLQFTLSPRARVFVFISQPN